MSLTLNEFLLLVITIAVVGIAVFLIMLFIQIKKTAKAGEETLEEITDLVKELKTVSQEIQPAIKDAGEMIDSARKTAGNLKKITDVITIKIIRPYSRYWPVLFPLLKIGWKQIKKRKKKGGNYVR